MLRAIRETLNSIEEAPKMYGSPDAIEAQYMVLLGILGGGLRGGVRHPP